MSVNIKCPWEDWQVVDVLGRGGFGTVYKIHREVYGSDEDAAMKVIQVPNSQEVINEYYDYGYDDNTISSRIDEDIKRIVNEYNNMNSMKGHPNIVICDDFKVEPAKDGEGKMKLVFIKMELLTPFNKALREEGFTVTDKLAVKLGKDICCALMECEKRQIVHRDISPSNIFIAKDKRFKLGDFGIARTIEHTTVATRTGKHYYMAPEVFKSEKYNSTIDIYSLGMVLYWVLNNRKFPFYPQDSIPTAEDEQNSISRRINGEQLPAPVNGSEKLKEIVLKACAYNPADRYQSAAHMMEALIEAEQNTVESRSENIDTEKEELRDESQKDEPEQGHEKDSWNDDNGTIGEKIPGNEKKDEKADNNDLTQGCTPAGNKAGNDENDVVTPEIPPIIPKKEEKPKRKKIGLIIGISLCAVVIAGIIIWVVPSNKNTPLETKLMSVYYDFQDWDGIDIDYENDSLESIKSVLEDYGWTVSVSQYTNSVVNQEGIINDEVVYTLDAKNTHNGIIVEKYGEHGRKVEFLTTNKSSSESRNVFNNVAPESVIYSLGKESFNDIISPYLLSDIPLDYHNHYSWNSGSNFWDFSSLALSRSYGEVDYETLYVRISCDLDTNINFLIDNPSFSAIEFYWDGFLG